VEIRRESQENYFVGGAQERQVSLQKAIWQGNFSVKGWRCPDSREFGLGARKKPFGKAIFP